MSKTHQKISYKLNKRKSLYMFLFESMLYVPDNNFSVNLRHFPGLYPVLSSTLAVRINSIARAHNASMMQVRFEPGTS